MVARLRIGEGRISALSNFRLAASARCHDQKPKSRLSQQEGKLRYNEIPQGVPRKLPSRYERPPNLRTLNGCKAIYNPVKRAEAAAVSCREGWNIRPPCSYHMAPLFLLIFEKYNFISVLTFAPLLFGFIWDTVSLRELTSIGLH